MGAADGLWVPDGFEIVEFSTREVADDIQAMTLDESGRIFVGGRGYLRTLVDDDGDGRADRAIEFAAGPASGAMGLLWNEEVLYVVGDGAVLRYFDRDRDDRADGPPETLTQFQSSGEHGPHAILRGPDGWFYVMAGNESAVTARWASTAQSPIRAAVAGCLIRFSPDWKQSEIVADGFRNACDFDFDPSGEIFTYDSDNERCVSLPWYEPTRFYHVIPGGHYGWQGPTRLQTWRMPPYFPDVVAPVVTLGRGSPTGVACYRHVQFPEHYRGGFFALDWTFGRVWFLPVEPRGSRFAAKPKIFLEPTGDNGFAPTDVVVHPATGDLYLSIGGRGTRGAVYRIRHNGGYRESFDPAAIAQLQPAATKRNPATDGHVSSGHMAASAPLADANMDNETRLRRLFEHLDGFLASQRESDRISYIRAAQKLVGDIGSPAHRADVWAGYSLREPTGFASRLPERIWSVFPTHQANVDRELSRLAAMIEWDDPGFRRRVMEQLTDASDPLDDIHNLIVLSRLKGDWDDEAIRHVADAMLKLEPKILERRLPRDRNWPLRLGEMHRALARKHPPLNETLLASPLFGLEGHLLWTSCPGLDRKRAADRMYSRAKDDPEWSWTPDFVTLISELPFEDIADSLRRRWNHYGLRDPIGRILAAHAAVGDRNRFLDWLKSAEGADLSMAIGALETIGVEPNADAAGELYQAIRRPCVKQQANARTRVAALLARSLGESPPTWEIESWIEEIPKRHGYLVESSATRKSAERAALYERIAHRDGNAARGRTVYERLGCRQCHSGALASGPDLTGVVQRFSHEDLWTAIVDPHRDVADRYATTTIRTRSGRVYFGMVVYEAVDSCLLLLRDGQTVRIDPFDIEERRAERLSLMPDGLLDAAADQEVADLMAYLRSLVAAR